MGKEHENNGRMETDVKLLKSFLKERLFLNCKFEGFREQRNELSNILRKTVSFGESDSVLIVGPRGSGKSSVVRACLKDLEKDIFESEYLVVNLNGLVHTDDNLALRGIIEQLHIKELDGSQITGSFSDNLLFVLESLKSGDKQTTKAILFILDEFQLFCTHQNQTLLYNLFDITKSPQTPICVVGLTCRYDITELLEKRVSSRFSHRQVLLVQDIDRVTDSEQWRMQHLANLLRVGRRPPSLRNIHEAFLTEWDKSIDSLFLIPSVTKNLRRQLQIEPNERAFRNSLFVLISRVTSSNPFISYTDVEQTYRKYYVDEKVNYLKDLSILELCLIIAMSHQVQIYEGEPFNFEMVAKRYLRFVQGNSSVQITQRPIILKAYERIKELELILPITTSTKNQKKEFVLHNLMVTKSQVCESVSSYSGLPTDVSQWALASDL